MKYLIRANALLINEDEEEENFDEDGVEKPVDGEIDDNTDMSNWEN